MQFLRAFTMIELIFVIVIIGILSAIAIPKLTATRNDARVSEVAMNIMQGVSEIASYEVSQGHAEDNLSKMSNGINSLVDSGSAVLNTSEKKVTIGIGSVPDCMRVQIQTDTQANDANISVDYGDANSDKLCKSLQSAVDRKKYSMKLKGTSVKY